MLHAELFSSLSSPVRLELIEMIHHEGGLCVNDIAQRSGISQANASRHLIILRDAGAITVERQNNKKLYRVSDHRVVGLVKAAKEIAGITA